MSEDAGLIPLFTTQFSTKLDMLLQQKTSMLRGKVDEGFHVGKMASPVNQVGPVSVKAPAGRFAPIVRTDAEYVRRWVTPAPGDLEQLVDTFDELQTITDPKSQLVASAAAGAARWWDDQLIAAATGPAQLGQDASALTTETFNTTNFQIAVGEGATGSNGFSVEKLLSAKQILRHYHNDMDEEVTCVIGSQQEHDLLQQQQVTSRQYNEDPVLKNGRLSSFAGFSFVISERLPANVGAANQRGVFCFVKSGLYLGMWKDFTTTINRLNHLTNQPWQIYSNLLSGATRTQPGKIIQILCADTTGADITP